MRKLVGAIRRLCRNEKLGFAVVFALFVALPAGAYARLVGFNDGPAGELGAVGLFCGLLMNLMRWLDRGDRPQGRAARAMFWICQAVFLAFFCAGLADRLMS